MPISVTCPACEATYRVADEAAGKAIKCKKCGARVPVPAAAVEDEDDLAFDRPAAKAGRARDDDEEGPDGTEGDEAASSKSKKKPASSKKIWIIVASVLGVSCCLCTGVGGAVGYWLYNKANTTVNDMKQGKEAFKDLKDNPFMKKDNPFMKDAVKPPPPATGKIILEQKGKLTANDPMIEGKPAKAFKVNLQANKTYVIDLQSTEMDSFLRLQDPANKEVAQDDDGGGFPNARITYRPTQAGAYTIQATVFIGGVPPQGANFALTVREQ